MLGEIGLEGDLRPVRGALAGGALRPRGRRAVRGACPPSTRPRRRWWTGSWFVPRATLAEVCGFLAGRADLPVVRADASAALERGGRRQRGLRRGAEPGDGQARARDRGRRGAQPDHDRAARCGKDDARATSAHDPAEPEPRGGARGDEDPQRGRERFRAGHAAHRRASVSCAAPHRERRGHDRRRRRGPGRAK